MNRILYIGHVDLIARGRGPVHREIQVGLAQHAEYSQVLDSFNRTHDADDLIGFLFQDLQIIAINLGGQFAFHAADRLFHVVFNGLGTAPDRTGNFLVQFPIHGGDQFIFVVVKDRPSLFFGLEIDEEFRIEEAGCVGAVVRTSHLADALRNFRERAKQYVGLVGLSYAFVRAGAGREGATHPDRTFVQVGQKLGTDSSAKSEIRCHEEVGHTAPTVSARRRMAQRTATR